MISAATIRLLIEAGVTGEALLRIVDSIEEDGNAVTKRYRNNGNGVTENGNGVTYNAQKQARYRARRKVTEVTRVTVTEGNAPPSPETKVPPTPPLKTQPLSPKENPPLQGGQKKTPEPTCRSELEAVLDPEHATAVIDHRQRLGSGLTAHAAKLLAAEFAKCADANAAADQMISRGWRGFKPKWLDDRSNGSTGPPSRPMTGSAKLVELLKKPFEETYGRGNGQDPPGPAVRAIRDR